MVDGIYDKYMYLQVVKIEKVWHAFPVFGHSMNTCIREKNGYSWATWPLGISSTAHYLSWMNSSLVISSVSYSYLIFD